MFAAPRSLNTRKVQFQRTQEHAPITRSSLALRIRRHPRAYTLAIDQPRLRCDVEVGVMAASFTQVQTAAYYAYRTPDVKQRGSQWRGPCPIHRGNDDNFAVDPETGLYCCHSHCGGGDIIELEMKLSGASFGEAKAEVSRITGTSFEENAITRHRHTTTAKPQPAKWTVVAEYLYRDEEGKVLFKVIRKEQGSGSERKKTFSQAKPDGNGGWIFKMEGARKVPYNLPDIKAADPNDTILVVEGEKAVEAAKRIGFVATCNSGGAGKWRPEHAEPLEGRHVAALPDADEVGKRHAEAVVESLLPLAASVKVINLPGLPPKGDIVDWIDAGGTREELLMLIAEAPHRMAVDNSDDEDEEKNKATELEAADQFVELHGENLRYVSRQKEWFQWLSTHWRVDHSQAVHRLAITMIREQKLKNCETSRKLNGILALAGAHERVAALMDDFDQHDFLLNFKNGTLDLRTGDLSPCQRGHNLTKFVPFSYDPAARAPRWERFLREVFENHQDIVEWIQKAIGYSLTGDVREHCFFLMHGTGRNGKGVFVNTIRQIFADYAHQADFQAFESKHGDGPRDGIANLRGARFVAASESRDGARLGEEIIKSLTGGDTIRARLLNQNSFEMRPTWKIWLATNYKPQIRGTDPGIWSRVRLIPFEVSFAGREDRTLPEALLAEAPGIIAWAVEGAIRWREEGLEPTPAAVRLATANYRTESDIIGRFLEERTEKGEYYSVGSRELYRAYVSWADGAGEHPMKETAFGLRLGGLGLSKGRNKYGVYYSGLRLLGLSKGASEEDTRCRVGAGLM